MHELVRAIRRAAAPAAILALLAASACGPARNGTEWDVLMPEAESADTTRISGSVAYMELEGGLYVLRTAAETNYNPTNLPESYRVDGAAVEADVVVRDDMASIGMVGPIVDIVRIRATGDGSGPAAAEDDATP